MEPYELSLTDASAAIFSGTLSPVELAESALNRINAVEPQIHAFATVTADLAMSQARAAGEEIAAGKHRGPLHGIPLGVKDLYNTAGIATTSSSKVREHFIPDTNSAAVTALADAGMVMVGKTHTHEFAFGAVTPTTRNPWDVTTIPGGSSGGSGAAVASGSCLVALGSDTGGSVRIPAALCGTVGLKPTYGRASRFGVASLSWSLDHVGPLTRNVTDAALVLNAMAGFDSRDPGSVDLPVPDFTSGLERGVKGLRIGIPVNFYTERVDPETSAAVATAVSVLEEQGAELVEVRVPRSESIRAAEWGIMMPEASAYHRNALRTTPELFTPEVRALLEIGETILATDYIDALRVRQLMKQEWQQMFADIDVLMAPSVAAPAVSADDPRVYWPDGTVEPATDAMVRLSAPANLTGLPAVSVPCGFSASGLPLGMQIIGGPFEESTILTVARTYELATDHVGRIAEMSLAAS
jgi:aspartyl-tRNA(Asn)/glutamyl-tRNA(Gln) amidotransferase subunit A